MAIFYDSIKGVSNETSCWSHIVWGTGEVKGEKSIAEAMLPRLFLTNTNSHDHLAQTTADKNIFDLGYLLSSDTPAPTFSKALSLPSGLYTDTFMSSDGKQALFAYNNANNTISFYQKLNGNAANFDSITATGIESSNIEATKINSSTLEVTGKSTFTTVEANNITASNNITAAFFDATSDRRAKINIKPIDISALDMISHLPVYTFTYVNTQAPSIGIMAQDAKELEFANNFNLVHNINASGKDGDFMTVKEDKLIYVLLKAVQEQQDEIAALKEEIKSLKK